MLTLHNDQLNPVSSQQSSADRLLVTSAIAVFLDPMPLVPVDTHHQCLVMRCIVHRKAWLQADSMVRRSKLEGAPLSGSIR